MSKKVTILINPDCSKCKESLDLLGQANCEIEIIEYLKDVPSVEDLHEIIQLLRIKPQDLVRKSEEVYKINFEGKNLKDSEWIEAMLKFPILMERPIAIYGKKAVIGRPPSLILDLL